MVEAAYQSQSLQRPYDLAGPDAFQASTVGVPAEQGFLVEDLGALWLVGVLG